MCRVHTDIALSLVGRWQLAQTMAMTNPGWWKCYWQTTKVSVTPADGSEHFAYEQPEQQAGVLFKNPEKPFLLESFTSRTVPDKKCLCFYLPIQRLKNFALISVSDRDFMRVTQGDQQWFGEQSPSPILHKEPNTVCLGSGPSLDRGAVMSIA